MFINRILCGKAPPGAHLPERNVRLGTGEMVKGKTRQGRKR